MPLAIVLPSLIFSQSAERQVIAATGGFANSTAVSASFTVGEMLVTTAPSASIILTQGFQQPNDIAVSIYDVKEDINLLAYPNPAHSKVYVQLQGKNTGKAEAAVYDMMGNKINIPAQSSTGRLEFDFSSLAAAGYFISIKSGDGSFQKTIKVQKIN
ncbi:MAG: hypothetical protein JWO06_3447 [Bacteroidota bacterium]|nr:hypothetical protein [Bacteroidota bacterium]